MSPCYGKYWLKCKRRNVQRLEDAVGVTGPKALARVLEALELDSRESVANLETLKEIVLKLEELASEANR